MYVCNESLNGCVVLRHLSYRKVLNSNGACPALQMPSYEEVDAIRPPKHCLLSSFGTLILLSAVGCSRHFVLRRWHIAYMRGSYDNKTLIIENLMVICMFLRSHWNTRTAVACGAILRPLPRSTSAMKQENARGE
jgi:hypothetical protein